MPGKCQVVIGQRAGAAPKISYGRANELVSQLVALGLLAPVADGVVPGSRRFFAPQVLDVLVEQQAEHRATGSTA